MVRQLWLLMLPYMGQSFDVIDTHVHNADLNLFGNSFYTFATSFPDLNASWSMGDFAKETLDLESKTGAGISGVILMELEKQSDTFEAGLAEAAYYQSVANNCNANFPSASCGGAKVVGFVASAPLENGDDAVTNYLHTLSWVAPALVGIRRTLWKENDSFFEDSDFIAGLKALSPFNLTFDLLVEAKQLGVTASLIAKVPEVLFNLEHLGYPEISNSSAFDEWAASIDKIAALPNVYCKLSGLPQAYGEPGWTGEDFRPYVRKVLNAFGAERVNFAGNWFVLMEEQWEGSYVSMMEAVLQALDGVSQNDLDWVFTKTAMELYRIFD